MAITSERLTKLVVVASHAPFSDSVHGVPSDLLNPKHWYLQDFQKNEIVKYLQHIRAGVAQMEDDPESLLLFSGGRTRPGVRQWSEGSTYLAIANYFNFWKLPGDEDAIANIRNRSRVEGYARDSFQNILFSIMGFHQIAKQFPSEIDVVGWRFKEDRFKLHAKILGIPEESLNYLGINNPPDLKGAIAGESTAYDQWLADPLGLRPPLSTKRADRNPYGDSQPYGNLADYVTLASEANWHPSEVLLQAAGAISLSGAVELRK